MSEANNGLISNGKQKGLSFQILEDPKVLLPILKERLPKSCFMYNQVTKSDRFAGDQKIYILGNVINSDTWVVITYFREDWGQNVCISAPNAIVDGTEQISLAIKESFSNADFLKWDDDMLFVALEKKVSALMVDINVNVKGNVTEVHPCVLFHVDLEEARNIEIPPVSDVVIRRMHPESDDDVNFLLSTWNYSREGTTTELKKCLAAQASAGVYENGKCVAGVLAIGVGVLSALYTLPECRGKGYGKLTMRYAFKEFAKDGCIPCSTVEVRNPRSIRFHESIGAKGISIVDWLQVKKLVID